ncbi:hypothetical protein [Novibacillus thermophilus]|uniref:Lipoprotein n=1 Tax=Novibacillus thermophilus TaxID=1471761 RepID=A0A1U9K6L8_9BACL|nr:hypothetical protein [Novibacillus thermophilus]AQS55672.1 hypothetical protein B0W44_07605 [Novibacillus thermophilus]
MRRTLTICTIFLFLTLMTACNVANEEAGEAVKYIISKTLEQPSSWHGSFIVRNEGGGSLIHTTYNGVHNDDGYRVAIDTQGMGFDSQADVKKEGDSLYVKLPNSANWQKTTSQDLKMLGLGFTYNPIEFVKFLQDFDVHISTTHAKNVYKILVQAKGEMPFTPTVAAITGTDQLLPLDVPEIYVEVNPENQTLRSLVMGVNYTGGISVSYEAQITKERGNNNAENSN